MGEAGDDQVANPGQAQESHGVGALAHGEAGHLGQRAGDQHALGVLAHAQGDGHAGNDGVDVLQRAAEFDAEAVGAGVDAEGAAMQHRLHTLAEGFVLTGDHGGGQGVFGDLAGQVRPRQHADAGLGRDLFEDLAHQLETLRLDALGQADQTLAAQQFGMGRQHAAQGAGR